MTRVLPGCSFREKMSSLVMPYSLAPGMGEYRGLPPVVYVCEYVRVSLSLSLCVCAHTINGQLTNRDYKSSSSYNSLLATFVHMLHMKYPIVYKDIQTKLQTSNSILTKFSIQTISNSIQRVYKP